MSEEYIKNELAKYNLPDAKIAEMKARYLPLKVNNIEDIENYMACKEAHQEVKKVRIAIENKRKELKSSSLEFGRAVDAEAKRLTVGVSEVEEHLAAQRKVVEDEKKRIQEERERKIKEEEERLRREEEARLEAIRKEQEEKERKLQVEREKIEAEKRANEEEKARLQAEKEKQEQDKKDAEEAKRRAEQEEKDRARLEKERAEEVERAKKEAADRAVREEKERAEREAKEKADAEEAARVKAEKEKLMAPDKEKISNFALDLQGIELPQVKTPEAREIINTSWERINAIVEYLEKAGDLL